MSSVIRPALSALVPYEPGKPVEEVQRELGLDRVVKLASNEGPFGPFPAAIEAMERSLGELNRYPDGGGYLLREALAARHGVAFDQIALGAGGDGVIDCLAQATLDPGDNLIHTTDFRRVYATMIAGWMGLRDTRPLLKGEFEPFDLFQKA